MSYIDPFYEWETSKEITLTKEDIDFLNEKVNHDRQNPKIKIIPSGEHRYRLEATSWVGAVKIPNSYSIMIRPKVGNLNFIKMLVYSENLEGIELFDLVGASEGEDLVDFMAKLFLEVTNPIIQEGIYKSYVSITEEIPSVRGRLLITQNIRHPRLTHEKFWCEHDELSTDVLENQILLYCTKLLSLLVTGYDLKRKLREFQRILESQGISDMFLEPYHLDLISLQKLNEHYEEALRLCEFILKIIWYHDFAKEENLPIYGFLYDMNRLFQNFVTKIIKETFGQYNVYREPPNFDLLERIENLSSDDEKAERISEITLLPDIVIEDKKLRKPVLVVDTKYKAKTSTGDIYQSTAYSLTLECPVLLLIPQIGNKIMDGFKIRPIYRKSGQIYIRSVDFSDSENYIEEMKRRIKDALTPYL